MAIPLRVLIVEDLPDDAELVVQRLVEEGYLPEWRRVETEPEYAAALETHPDLILADWWLPSFSGLRALHILRERKLDIPFIIASGTIGEETAVDALRQGAYDYVFKDRPVRLGQAVRNALREKQLRAEKSVAERALAESNEFFMKAFQNNPTAMGISQYSDGTYIFINEAFTRLIGYTAEEAVGKNLSDLNVWVEDKQREIVGRLLYERGQPVQDFDLIYRTKSGEERVGLASAEIIDIRGEKCILSSLVDITERKRTGKKIQELSQFRERIIDSSSLWMHVLDREGNVKIWNKAAETISGYSGAEMLGRGKYLEWLYPDEIYRNQMRAMRERIFSSEISLVDIETTIRCKCGENKVISWNSNRLMDEDGNCIGIITLGRDVTEQKKSEQDVRKLSLAVEHGPHAILITDREGRIEYVNPKFIQMTGFSREEAIGQNPRILKSGEHDTSFYKGMWDTLVSGNEWRGEIHNKKKEGEHFWASLSISPMKDNKGEITHFVGVSEDISQRKRLEQMLIQSEKLAAIGTLAAGIAHEINNPIGYVQSNLITLKKYNETLNAFCSLLIASLEQAKSDSNGTAGAYCAEILGKLKNEDIKFLLKDTSDAIVESLEGADKVRRIVQGLRDFSREGKPEFNPADINEGIEKTLTIIRNELKYKAQVEKELGDLPKIECDIQRMSQVFMNVILNAAQAIEEHGIIRIKTSVAGNAIMVQISDTGQGIAEQDILRIFDPFFTTKEAGKGTGLGLSISYSIVQEHGGKINVNSEVGKGTTFTILLPIDRSKEIKEKRILIVDDEDGVRTILQKVIHRYDSSIQIKCAVNGYEAADSIHSFKPDVILLDINLPGMNGLEICRKFSSSGAKMKVIIMTGLTGEHLEKDAIDAGAHAFIRKPFNITSVEKLLNTCFG